MIKDVIERTKRFLSRRAQDYRLTFDIESPVVQNVLKDLAKFCRAHETSFNPDQRAHALIEGRREVWLRIQNHLNLTSDQLWKLYGGGERYQREDNS
jgi:hypothetical protein